MPSVSAESAGWQYASQCAPRNFRVAVESVPALIGIVLVVILVSAWREDRRLWLAQPSAA
jgi:hypothetical protein